MSEKKHLSDLLQGLIASDVIPDLAVSGLASDSRQVKPGDLFLAYKGLQHDGRLYIKEAIQSGAAAILCEAADYPVEIHHDIPTILLNDLRHHLGEIAARFYDFPSRAMRIIGVTGTNGKTSCTHFIATILSKLQIPTAVMGTLGYGFLPTLQPSSHTTLDAIQLEKILSELRAKKTAVVAMEVSSHALDQRRVDGVQFEIAVFTQLSRDHLDYHGDMAAYARAKELLFEQPGLRYGVVNLDDELGRLIVDRHHQRLQLIGYSQAGKIDHRIECVQATEIIYKSTGFSAKVRTPWGDGELQTTLLGRFNISNLLAVLSVLALLKLPLNSILEGISQLTTVRGRMQCVNGDHLPMVVVDYAHTPDALEKTLNALRGHCQGKLWCVFGCGGERDRGKRPEMAKITEQFADRVIVTSDNPRHESLNIIIDDIMTGFHQPKAVIVECNRQKAIEFAVQNAVHGDIVLVAGKGHETVQIIGDQQFPFDDMSVVQNALRLMINEKPRG